MQDEPLAPADAARTLRALHSYDAQLRQRMEGVLWMILGLVFSCLFLAYAFAALADLPAGALAFLWAPWVAAGTLVLHGMRRGFALSTGDFPAAAWARPLLAFALVSLGAMAVFVLVGSEAAPVAALLLFASLALAPALVPRAGYTPLGRRVGVALGALGIGAGLPQVCPACGARNALDAKFCDDCGTALRQTCASCGADNAGDAEFCDQCGSALPGADRGAPPR